MSEAKKDESDSDTVVICSVCNKQVTPSKEAHFHRWTHDPMKEHTLHANCWQRVVACRATLTEFIKAGL